MKVNKILKSEPDYNSAIERVIELFDAQPGSTKFDELELLLVLVKDYEDKHYTIPSPNPIEVIKLKMQETGLKNRDLIPIIGSEGHVSAVLSGKRKMTLEMAKNINDTLGIPAEVLLNITYSKEKVTERKLNKYNGLTFPLQESDTRLNDFNAHTILDKLKKKSKSK